MPVNEGKLIPLRYPAGFFRRGTPYNQTGHWLEGNMVRFDADDSLRAIGGWLLMALGGTPIEGTVRSFFAWRDNLSRTWWAIGTTEALYVWDGSNLRNITPVGVQFPGEDVGVRYGYGTGQYNTGSYNTAIGSGTTSNSGAAVIFGFWHLDNWGQNLLAMIDSDGKLYEWNPDTPSTPAAIIAGAPVNLVGMCVTNERHVMLLGVESGGDPNPRATTWSDRENNTVYTPGALNLAGTLNLQTNGIAMRAIRFGLETLAFTDVDVHRTEYLGYPDVYVWKKIASDCGLAAPGAIAVAADRVFWVGPRGFHYYDGNGVRTLDCPLFDNAGEGAASIAQNGKITVGHNKLFNEFVIHYSTTPNGNPDRYIIYNYVRGWWADGALDRSCWFDSDLNDLPFGAQPYFDGTNYRTRLFKHETGVARPEYSEVDFATPAPIEIGDGDQFIEVDRIMQDSELDGRGRLQCEISFYKAPNTDPLKTTTVTLNTARGYTDVRGTGRMISISPRMATVGGGWNVGRWRVRGKPAEQR